MSLAFQFHPATVVLAIILAGLLTWWSYRRTTPAVSVGRRWVLGTLRFLALSIVIVLLADPLIRATFESERSPKIAVLLDTSRSLSPDVNPSDPAASARSALEDIVANIEAEIMAFGFDGSVIPLDNVDSLLFDDARSDLAGALASVRQRLADEPLGALILISDGIYNTGRNPIYAAQESNIPIYTVLVGDTTARRDVVVDRVTANEISYVGRETPVQAVIRADGLGGRRARVTLEENDSVLAARVTDLPDGQAELTVDLNFIPAEEGFHNYSVSVEPVAGELTESNNRVEFGLQILEREVAIALFASGPSPDLAAVRDLLQRDEGLKVTAFVQRDRNSWYGESPPSSFDAVDLFVLVGYPGAQADPAVIRSIAESPLPLVFIVDRATDLRLTQQYLGDRLPATPRRVRRGFLEAGAEISPVGLAHPVFDLETRGAGISRLPPLAYPQTGWDVAPDARTLATIRVRGISLEDPLLVVQTRAGTRTAAFLASGVWRWANVPVELDQEGRLLPDLLENVIQWVSTSREDNPVRVTPVEERFDGGEPVRLVGQVYDESMNPASGAALRVSVRGPDGREISYPMKPEGNGRFSRNIGLLEEGTYTFVARANQDEFEIGADSGQFAVGPLNLEVRQTRANPAAMMQIASRSGGQYVTVAEVDDLLEALERNGALRPQVEVRQQEMAVRRLVPLLFVVIALLAGEWILRKRSGMV